MRLSRKDIFFLSLRITITLSLIYYLGVIKGLLILWTYFTSLFYLMKWVFGLESLSPIDTLLNHDDDKNVANIVSKPFKYSLAFRCGHPGEVRHRSARQAGVRQGRADVQGEGQARQSHGQVLLQEDGRGRVQGQIPQVLPGQGRHPQ